MDIQQFVMQHTIRGECKCGKCCDVGNLPDPDHAVDLCFFKVAKKGEPSAEEFKALTEGHSGAFGPVNPLDGKEHSYIELGGWIGDQGLALLYMGLGVHVGAFKLLSPQTMLGLEGPEAMQLAGMGLLSIQAA